MDSTGPGNQMALNFPFYSPFPFSCRHLLSERTIYPPNKKKFVVVYREVGSLSFCLNFFIRLCITSQSKDKDRKSVGGRIPTLIDVEVTQIQVLDQQMSLLRFYSNSHLPHENLKFYSFITGLLLLFNSEDIKT